MYNFFALFIYIKDIRSYSLLHVVSKIFANAPPPSLRHELSFSISILLDILLYTNYIGRCNQIHKAKPYV